MHIYTCMYTYIYCRKEQSKSCKISTTNKRKSIAGSSVIDLSSDSPAGLSLYLFLPHALYIYNRGPIQRDKHILSLYITKTTSIWYVVTILI